MASRLTRALRRMTDASALPWWRPQGFDAPVPPPVGTEDAVALSDEGSDADLRERRREVAFDMYAEALLRMTAADAAAHRRGRRASA